MTEFKSPRQARYPDRKANVLVVDEEQDVRKSLEMILSDLFVVNSVATAGEALDMLSRKSQDVILLDVCLPDADGVKLIELFKDIDPHVKIIVLATVKQEEIEVRAMKAGAFEYMLKPFTFNDIRSRVSRALEKRWHRRLSGCIKGKYRQIEIFEKMVGSDKKMFDVYELISKVSESSGAVLIQGETGTGKELVARAIHNISPRKEQPFVVINCAAIPPTLMESEVFGHTRGAFTGATSTTVGKIELGGRGSVFLDDVDTMDLSMQAKMLRVLQEKEFERLGSSRLIQVDARFIAASNRPFQQLIEEGRFREDLFYRLNVFPIHLPPLRERRGDIPMLLDYFSMLYATNNGNQAKTFSSQAIKTLTEHNWPGNVRELQNLVERLSVIIGESVIEVRHLKGFRTTGPSYCPVALKDAIKFFERGHIKKILDSMGGSRKKTSEALGIHRNTLLGKINRLGL